MPSLSISWLCLSIWTLSLDQPLTRDTLFVQLVTPEYISFLLSNKLPKRATHLSIYSYIDHKFEWTQLDSLFKVSQKLKLTEISCSGLLSSDSGEESMSKLIQVAWIYFLAVEGLWSLYPCWSSAEGSTQLLEAAHIPLHMDPFIFEPATLNLSESLWCCLLPLAGRNPLLLKGSTYWVRPIQIFSVLGQLS